MDPMNPVNTQVSVIDPINPAIERVKLILFAPFDLGRWFVIGFCAWLANMVPSGSGGRGGSPDRANLETARNYVLANLSWIVPLAIAVVVVGIGVMLLMVWLSSRGRFMFLDCVARNVAHVRDPWHRFRSHAASLFGFRVAVGLIMLAISLAIGAAGVVIVLTSHAAGFPPASVLGLVAVGLVFFVMSILFLIVGLFTTDFVVPIMYLHGVSCTQAWRMLLDLLSWNQGRFILYILFRALLGIVIGIVVTGVGCITCGCACCFLSIPYIGTVVMLPILIFVRSYSAYYLSQYGPQFNVFPPPPPAPPVAG
jgi:hypothetical protein